MSRHHDDLPSIDPSALADVSGGAGMADMLLPMIMMLKKRNAGPAPAPPPAPPQPQQAPLPAGAERTTYYSDGTSRSG